MHEQLNARSIKYNWHDARVSVLEGIFARGDRKLSAVLLAAYQAGALFDAWTETFSEKPWEEAFVKCGIDGDFYVHREREVSEILPWDFIDIGVSRTFLEKEWERAKQEIVTPNCREQCNGCGAAVFGGGICHAR